MEETLWTRKRKSTDFFLLNTVSVTSSCLSPWCFFAVSSQSHLWERQQYCLLNDVGIKMCPKVFFVVFSILCFPYICMTFELWTSSRLRLLSRLADWSNSYLLLKQNWLVGEKVKRFLKLNGSIFLMSLLQAFHFHQKASVFKLFILGQFRKTSHEIYEDL